MHIDFRSIQKDILMVSLDNIVIILLHFEYREGMVDAVVKFV